MKELSVSNEERQRHDPSWPHASSSSHTLLINHVDVWKIFLDEPAVSGLDKATPLSPDEIARANRFHFERDRNRFVRCRSALRALLAGYLAMPASEIRFEYQANGKPAIAATQNPSALHFNLSHSANMAVVAFAGNLQLGIDIEKIRFDVDTAALAERFFSLRERTGLRTLPDHLRVPAFYACWTRKESFLKATGDGLSFPLADFSVTTHPDLDPQLEEIRGNTEARTEWTLTDLNVEPGYRATLAVEGATSPLTIETQTYL
jgi:4'-phosphopantetheinyl transferase